LYFCVWMFCGEGEKEIKRKMERPHVCGVIKMTKK
jgi:hypothetical protein